MSFTLRQIRYFVAVAEHGKVSKAASAVSISPSSVTTAVQELEDQLGVSLFERHRKGLRLTFEGNHFLQHSHNILAAVSTAKYALSRGRIEYSGRLKIGVTITVAGYFLAPLFTRFKRSFPNIDIQVIENKRNVIERMLVEGNLDIALILTSNIQNNDGIAHETLVRSYRHLWVPPSHPFLEYEKVTLEDVAKEPYLQLTIDEATTTHLNFWKKRNLEPNIVFLTESVEAMRSLVATGAGVTILSDMVYRPWSLEGDRIELISLAQDIPSMNVGLAWNRASNLKDNANAFLEYCRMEYLSGRRSYRSEITTD